MLKVMVLGGGASGRCLGHEGGGFMNGISCYKGGPSPFLPCDDTMQEVWDPAEGPRQPCQHPGLRLSAL